MIPKRITDFEEYLKLLPQAVEAFDKSYTRWNRELTNMQLTNELVNAFNDNNELYCDVDEEGKILYFFALNKIGETSIHFWIIYVHPDVREHSRDMLNWLYGHLKDIGYNTVEFTTTRLTRSYKRWAEKFNARPYAMTYRVNLHEEIIK
jgi:GNAT superfamily N-acetyltransferase